MITKYVWQHVLQLAAHICNTWQARLGTFWNSEQLVDFRMSYFYRDCIGRRGMGGSRPEEDQNQV